MAKWVGLQSCEVGVGTPHPDVVLFFWCLCSSVCWKTRHVVFFLFFPFLFSAKTDAEESADEYQQSPSASNHQNDATRKTQASKPILLTRTQTNTGTRNMNLALGDDKGKDDTKRKETTSLHAGLIPFAKKFVFYLRTNLFSVFIGTLYLANGFLFFLADQMMYVHIWSISCYVCRWITIILLISICYGVYQPHDQIQDKQNFERLMLKGHIKFQNGHDTEAINYYNELKKQIKNGRFAEEEWAKRMLMLIKCKLPKVTKLSKDTTAIDSPGIQDCKQLILGLEGKKPMNNYGKDGTDALQKQDRGQTSKIVDLSYWAKQTDSPNFIIPSIAVGAMSLVAATIWTLLSYWSSRSDWIWHQL